MPHITARDRRFKIDSSIRLKADIHHRGSADAAYKVVRLMPAEGQDYQYRIKDGRAGGEYVVLESAIR
mgnify:CR=1 FL=1